MRVWRGIRMLALVLTACMIGLSNVIYEEEDNVLGNRIEQQKESSDTEPER